MSRRRSSSDGSGGDAGFQPVDADGVLLGAQPEAEDLRTSLQNLIRASVERLQGRHVAVAADEHVRSCMESIIDPGGWSGIVSRGW